MNGDSDRFNPRLELTRWSLIRRAGVSDEQTRRDALDELLRQYLTPLKAHLVFRRHVDRHVAEDLVQEFVARKVLHRDLLSTASPVKGRFRSLLLSALDRFTIDHFRSAEARLQRQSQWLDESAAAWDEAQSTSSNDADAFDLAWAATVLAEAIRRMQACCESSKRADLWGVFYHRVLAPLVTDRQALEYDKLVDRFALQSPERASNLLMTAKRLFHRELLAVVREYLDQEDDLDAELVELRNALSIPEAMHKALSSVFKWEDVSQVLSPLELSQTQRLSALLTVTEDDEDWQRSEWSSVFSHQLAMPLTSMLSRSQVAEMSKLAMELMHVRPPIRTLADLLHHPRAPRTLLTMAHRWARPVGNTPALPPTIADAVALCLQASAIIGFGNSLEGVSKDRLRVAWRELAAQPWLTKREAALVHRALENSALDPHTGRSAD